jgi:hypothetical protein
MNIRTTDKQVKPPVVKPIHFNDNSTHRHSPSWCTGPRKLQYHISQSTSDLTNNKHSQIYFKYTSTDVRQTSKGDSRIVMWNGGFGRDISCSLALRTTHLTSVCPQMHTRNHHKFPTVCWCVDEWYRQNTAQKFNREHKPLREVKSGLQLTFTTRRRFHVKPKEMQGAQIKSTKTHVEWDPAKPSSKSIW